MADTTIDLLKNSSYVGKMDELIAAVKSGGGTASDVEWDNVKNKPTTIGGYGIIDAKIDNGTITLGNQTITPLTSAPVTSVNNKTGAVTLSAADVSAIPSTLTGTAGQVLTKTADGQEWKDVEIPGGGGGASDMTLLAEVDCSQVSGTIELTGLNDLTEIYITSDAVQSNHESINSGYYIEINGVAITKNEFVPIYKSGYTAYVWGSIYYNGCVWVPIKSAGAISKGNYGLNYTNMNAPFNLIEGVGKAKKLRLVSPASQYLAVSGTIKIYGR